MHDFFVDRIVFVRDLQEFTKNVVKKSNYGGGSIHNVVQEEKAGGNAVNLAGWASLLGLKVLLITHSDEEHLQILNNATSLVAMKIVKSLRPGYTVSLESTTNVMVSYSGGAEEFGPEILTEKDWEAISNSKVLCIMNWSANLKGTDMVREARKRYNGAIFLDPADFRDRINEYKDFIKIASSEGLVDWYSFNEYEAVETGKIFGLKKEIKKLCMHLSDILSARVDIHTSRVSVTSNGKEVEFNLHKKLKERLRTGAGDVWNATSLFCHIAGMKEKERLNLSDTIASIYIVSSSDDEAKKKILSLLKHSRKSPSNST
jgi:sugar/nucleoside kinase (ribokinase family)